MNRTKKAIQMVMFAGLMLATTTVSARTLPTLIDFQVETLSDQVSLRWSVAGSSPSQTFVIERSYDAVQFEEVRTVRSEKSNQYRVEESNTSAQSAFYRLKVIDTSGQIHYSQIATALPNSSAR